MDFIVVKSGDQRPANLINLAYQHQGCKINQIEIT